MTAQKQSRFDIKKPRRRPRIAVLLCDCGQTLSDSLDLPAITAAVKKISGVSKVISTGNLCQPAGLDQCVADLRDDKITHVLVAACSPAYYQVALARSLDTSKLIVGQVNIREHCAWVHTDRDQASEKAFRLIKLAVQRLRLANQVADRSVRLNQRVLVIGAGLSGMQAALSLADRGHKVTLVTKSDALGGRAARQTILPEAAARDDDLAAKVRAARSITVVTGADLQSLAGEFGHFKAHLSQRDAALDCGAVVVTTGQSPQIHPSPSGLLNIEDLARMLRGDRARLADFKRIGVILDIHSQQDCAATRAALRLARRARQLWFCETYLFCQHLRVAGPDQEQEYQQARQAGVVVIKTAAVPEITEDVGFVRVTGTDQQTHRPFDLSLDLLAAADLPAGGDGQCGPGA